ncbi:Cj0069 family protein [Ramlibacter sp. MAH-25]|uniref:Cj0069 family protein n=1 Tax=Ramlibacter pinisoli TaxID=2682844 RepID=A0A6N8IQ67_9BURK|nr:Cj0069 family protein [Ramlibacter sp. CGMCC 1.13660]MVQ28988.1 Cj0069 family protein [Ramlibacter pinisoli]
MPPASFAPPRLAILYPGDRALRDRADPSESRFAPLFEAFAAAGVAARPAVYHDDFADEVRTQLLQVQAVLVWHNPIEGGRTRAVLDALLREVAARGVFVSTHPDTILRLGTKDILLAVRDLPFGSDAWRVDSEDALRTEVAARLAHGPRVLKQHRGHSGIGVWRIEARGDDRYTLQHAQRGALPETVAFDTVVQRLAPHVAAGGHMVDQAWQPRLAEGMVRAYLVGDRVAGFGHQAINALHPAGPDGIAPPPGPRLYSGPGDDRFQDLRRRLENGWVDLLAEHAGVARHELPLLWDADFLLGERSGDGERYVLCEVNVSSVAPFPPAAIGPLVAVVQRVLGQRAEHAPRPQPRLDQ